MSKASTSDHVKHEAKGWGAILLGAAVLLFLVPAILGAAGGAVVSAVPKAADAATCWPTAPLCPPERVREGATPTTAAARQEVTPEELQARMQAKSLGDGLAAARVAAPVPQVDPRGGLPSINGGGTGGIVGELPAVGGVVRALTQGGGLKALNP